MPSTGPLWLAAYTFATVENDIASAGELGAAVRDQNLVCLKQAPRTAAPVFRVLFWGEKKEKSIIGTFFRPRRKGTSGKEILKEMFKEESSELIGKTAKFSQTHSTD
jgi:hypothetical protein